jgi:prepilin-type N-terminal cleavage/methylation domain-containing protein
LELRGKLLHIFARNSRRLRKSGLTLVEVLVAAAIFAFCLSGLLLTYMNLFTLTDLSRDFTLASNAMQAKMEEIRQSNFSNLSSLNNTNFTVPGFAANSSSGIIQVYNTTYNDLKEVRLVVSFRCKNRTIGEESNFNGVFCATTEDTDGNGRCDSPAELVTVISQFK